jgi:hypothetical protein
MALNKAWHQENRMPPKATRAQRIQWHVAHAKNCSCREIPDSIRPEVEKLLKPGRKR